MYAGWEFESPWAHRGERERGPPRASIAAGHAVMTTPDLPPPDRDTVDETVTIGDRILSVVRPRSGQGQLGEETFGDEIVMPYWAEMWPSGVALARALVGRPLGGMRTLELGCGGLALPSIVASLGGARVLATDWSADAVAFA